MLRIEYHAGWLDTDRSIGDKFVIKAIDILASVLVAAMHATKFSVFLQNSERSSRRTDLKGSI